MCYVAFNEKDFDSYINGLEDVAPLNSFIIQTVSKYLPKWEELARYLELSSAEMEEIKQNDLHDYKEQKCKCIIQWVEKNGRDATLITLLRHIYFDMNDKLLINNIVECLKRSKQSGEQLWST